MAGPAQLSARVETNGTICLTTGGFLDKGLVPAVRSRRLWNSCQIELPPDFYPLVCREVRSVLRSAASGEQKEDSKTLPGAKVRC